MLTRFVRIGGLQILYEVVILHTFGELGFRRSIIGASVLRKSETGGLGILEVEKCFNS